MGKIYGVDTTMGHEEAGEGVNMSFLVTKKAKRPASTHDVCFYCHQPIGSEHKQDCVLVSKKVKVKMTVEYIVSVPADWTAENIDFHRNDSSWCANNALGELHKFSTENGCLCDFTTFDFVSVESEPYLDEGA